jgi:hypothetical protein
VFEQLCEICATTAQTSGASDVLTVKCSTCGEYKLNTVGDKPFSLDKSGQVRLSGWVREQNAAGVHPLITTQILRQVLAMRLPHLRERSDRALAELAAKFPSLEQATSKHIAISDPKLRAISYCDGTEEVAQLLRILEAEKSIESFGIPATSFRLTAKGLLAVDDMARGSNASAHGFVAMSFDAKMTDRG